MSEKGYWLLVTGLLACWCGLASAQTYYKWTDDHGVVHFSDAPPADPKGVEERHLAAPPVAEAPAKEAAVERAPEAQGKGAVAEPPVGPARVIVTSRKTPRTGPSALHVIGEVKNVGGADARRVAVTISAVDVTQGTPCLNEETTVEPSTLHPGDKGNFDVNVDSPCLFGDPSVDVAPVWD
jgi:uncharacterized protein DUF4124